jgi:hypothetical protein
MCDTKKQRKQHFSKFHGTSFDWSKLPITEERREEEERQKQIDYDADNQSKGYF